MNQTEILELGRQAMMIALQTCMPILLFGLVAGVLVSVFQAVTQIQEMTLTYIPKLLAGALALVLFGGWMLNQLVDFTSRTLGGIPPR
ncbi:MAG: flagellar biosynthesis protein FliQ [Armatimonadetes bacterium]|nr:flagellar biosynthesis protein FliQ [Armatimonadota bacterium]